MDNDFERVMFFEHARKTSEAAYAINPLDDDNLTKWGGALVELSQFQDVPESRKMIAEGISKLEEALMIKPQRHDALWCLGNANTTFAFLTPDEGEASIYFDKAAMFFQQAVDEDPTNELYRKSLDVAAKAPELHSEIHKQGAMGPGPSTSTSTKQSGKKEKSNDLKYDICGWIILVVGIVTFFVKSSVTVTPPPRT